VVPEVQIHRYFEGLVGDVLPPLLARSRGLLAHPQAQAPCPHSVEGEITLFVGPEGGFIDYELETLRGIGFESVHLGERVLRVEPVIPLLVGRLFR
jgi:16S rRNA U1498 N3-methylase RsmE